MLTLMLKIVYSHATLFRTKYVNTPDFAGDLVQAAGLLGPPPQPSSLLATCPRTLPTIGPIINRLSSRQRRWLRQSKERYGLPWRCLRRRSIGCGSRNLVVQI